jgi:GT2 family glycosyltransferase
MQIENAQSRYGLSIFAAPKPFRGHIGIIQHNAIQSWKELSITREVILLGDEGGIADAAQSIGAKHHKSIARDAFGTPLVDNAFEIAQNSSSAEWMCYVNADIILMPEFAESLARVMDTFERCLVISRRWNLDVRERLPFGDGWQRQLRSCAARDAKLFTPYGIDVFVFPKGLFKEIPPFSLGRPYWDNWMISRARQLGVPVADVTEPYSVIHQNHEYTEITSNKVIRRGQQGLRNFWLAGDSLFGLAHTANATHHLENREIKPNERKTVSVVIPHAGSYPQLRRCIQALTEQSYPRSYVEIILVENGEHTIAAPAMLEFPFIKFTTELRPGPAAARNKGAAIAEGEIIAFLDSDCRPAGDWLEQAISLFDNASEAIVACNIKPWDPCHGSLAVRSYEALAYHDQKGYVEHCKACTTGGMLVSKHSWLKVGPFDEHFPEAACEDWEWSTRASAQGLPIIFATNAVVRHPVHVSWPQLRHKARRQARGELLLARKRSRYRALTFEFQFSFYSRRMMNELKRIVQNSDIPFHVKPLVAAAAFRVWFWSLKEARKQLLNLPNFMFRTATLPSPTRIKQAGWNSQNTGTIGWSD